ncbi:MAG: BMP family ABC transporter substrate-binding protein [Candidatus Nanopelagicales bacterium]
MHRKLLVAGFAAAALVLAGCSSDSGGDAATETAAEETVAEETAAEEMAEEEVVEEEAAAAVTTDDSNCAAPENYCIGLVTDTGKVDDKSFNQAAWEGTQLAAEKVGGFAKYIETTDPKDYANNIGQFAQADYDTIVTVGFLMAEATGVAAAEYPDIDFIGVDQFQGETIPNLTGLVFNEDRAGYAAGYLAGLMTQTGKVGAVLGTDTVPPVKLFGEGYKVGAQAANPDVEVTLVYHEPNNAFNDPEWGAAESRKQLDQGADVIFAAGGNTGNGGLIEIAKDPGAGTTVFCIGVDIDQYFTVPQAAPCLLTSAEKKLVEGTEELVLLSYDGAFPGGNFFGPTGLAPYHDTEAAVPADVQAAVAEVLAGLQDGSIDTGGLALLEN